MGRTRLTATAGTAVALALAGVGAVGVASADDPVQHNVTYRARVDGLARGALITYRISDSQVNSADPTMLPGRWFEATAVLTDPKEAGMRISIQWPYSANLHCEILVDDQMVAQADQFIRPRAIPARDDPDYGAMNCGAPLSNAPGLPAGDAATPPAAPGEGTEVPLPADPAAPAPDPAAPAPDPAAPAPIN
ncbi:MAG: hypothetical protein ACR2JM_06365 [Mycobacterium sp.]